MSLVGRLIAYISLFCITNNVYAFSPVYAPDIRFKNLSIHDGLSQSQVNCIAQDEQGFIWIGTQDGLNKYDGYEFVVYKNYTKKKNAISGNYIHDILYDKQVLWVATDRGLDKINLLTNSVEPVRYNPKTKNTISSNSSSKLFRDKKGRIWIGDLNGKVTVYHPKKNTYYPLQIQQVNSRIHVFQEDSLGNMWIGTERDGVCILNSSFHVIDYDTTWGNIRSISFIGDEVWLAGQMGIRGLKNARSLDLKLPFEFYIPIPEYPKPINKIIIDKSENIWLATEGDGIYKVKLSKDKKKHEVVSFKTNYSKNKSLIDNVIHDLIIDHNNILWIGTSNGISLYPNRNFFIKAFNYIEEQSQNLTNNVVWSILEDSKGDLWVGTRNGLTQYHQTGKVSKYFSTEHESINPNIFSLYEDPLGNLWAGTGAELLLLKKNADNTISHYEKIDLPHSFEGQTNKIYKIFFTKKKYFLLGTKNGVIFFRPEDQQSFFISQFKSVNGDIIKLSSVRDIGEDDQGNIWLATESGVYAITAIFPSSKTMKIQSLLPLIQEETTCLLVKGRTLWIGTYGRGIKKVDLSTKLVESITEEEGLSNNVVYGILPYKNELWISTNRGVTIYSLKERKCRFITSADGLQSNEFNTGAYFLGKNDKLFFGGINGFDIIYPRYRVFDRKAPTPVITEFKANNKELIGMSNVSYSKKIELRHSQNNISIRFSGLHFFTSDKNYYYYKLLGFDEDWNYSKNNHPIIYNNLDPGKYIFMLKGCNSDDICSEPLQTEVVIKPALWQTNFFKLFLALVLVGLVYLGVKARVSIVNTQKKALEVLVQRRTKEVIRQKEQIEIQKKEIEDQKKKAEDLLLRILPEQTVSQLQTYGSVRALSYRLATVMFTDFKGFTRIAEELTPEELLKKLDGHFSKFDDIVDKHHIEKIKTIGDSYMAVGGIPIRNKSNPFDVVLAALEIVDYIEMQKNVLTGGDEKSWDIRIGVHTGELIAGVIGAKRFAYDIWGDTVNVANRLETACEIGKINISGQTYLQIKDFFECTYRGKIEAKNKGYIDMYYVNRIKPEFSNDSKGILPNQHFKDSIEMYLFGNILNYKKAEKNILQKLREELPANLYYHSVSHTMDVRDAAVKIAIQEGFNNQDILLLKVAALYHDAGFIMQYKKNEELGAKMAREELPAFGFSELQVAKISQLILATSFPYQPQTELEKVICDADLDYLGRDDFFEISDRLKREYIERGIVRNEIEFDRLQIDFLTSHQYFTKTSIARREQKKQRHLEFVKTRFRSATEIY